MTNAEKRYNQKVLENKDLLEEALKLDEQCYEYVCAADAASAAARKLRTENAKLLAEVQKQHAEIQAIVDKLVGHKKAR